MLLPDPNSLIGYRINDGHIKLMSVLGVGGSGVVYHAVECCTADLLQPTDPRQFAIKALSKVGLEPDEVHRLELEFELHTRVSDHPNVVTFHGIIEEEDFFFVLLDYLPEGDIFDKMEIDRVYVGNDDLIKSVFLQLIDVVEYCHNLGVSHRDIKPENILCKDGGSHILLADFGLGTDCRVVQEYGLGSESYMAPQCFGGFWQTLGPYSAAQADIWSLGVVLVNLACACNPWHKATEESPIFKNFFDDSNYLLEILPISRELNDVLKRTFTINPQARISLQELRVKVRSIKRFTLTKEQLHQAGPDINGSVKGTVNAQKSAHAIVSRRILTLTAGDIGRLECEAWGEACKASARSKTRALVVQKTKCLMNKMTQLRTLLLSRGFSLPSTTIAHPIPHAHHTTFIDTDSIFVISMSDEADFDSDSDLDSDADSDGPITPQGDSGATEVYITAVPEINLDGPDPSVHNTSIAHKDSVDAGATGSAKVASAHASDTLLRYSMIR